MTKYLKDIWTSFEGTTTRQLTGRGVDNIHVPSRRDYAAPAPEASLPEGFDAPATAAFAALKERLAETDRRRNKRLKGEGRDIDRPGRQDYSDAIPPAPLSGEAYGREMADSTPNPAMQMMKGLHATQMRTNRPDADYVKFLADEEKRTGRRKGGLFGVLKKFW